MAFDWFGLRKTTEAADVTKQPRRTPKTRDWTDDYQANADLTRALYHNTYPGMKLAGGLAFNPIAVPVWFMGLPIPSPVTEDQQTQDDLNYLVKKFATKITQLHVQSHRDGTIWVWPRWSARAGRLVWEFIQDDCVSDIIRDIDSGDIIEIITDEQILIKIAQNKTINATRVRSFTREKITIKWSADAALIPGELIDVTSRNPLGIMPIPFANNAEADEVRGESDYSRIITDLKDYHDIDLACSTMLAKFNVKMIQEVTDVDKWTSNNGYGTIADIDIQNVDLIINMPEEKTTFAFPERANEAYDAALKRKFQKIVESSGVPEIAWGLKTEGNRASVEESMGVLIKFVHEKQAQKNDNYKRLFIASLQLMRRATLRDSAPEININWNDLDAVSDEVRSIIFRNFSQGVSALVSGAGATKEQLFKMWQSMYPRATETDFQEFKIGLSDMAALNQWKNANYVEALDFTGEEHDNETMDNNEE